MAEQAGAGGGETVVGVLLCDRITDPDLVAAAGGRNYPELYAELLAGAAITVRCYDAVVGELPADPGECDAWLITGSRHDSYRDEPWIVALRQFVATLREHRARTVGICFGHQVLAHALGGRAEPAGRWQAGPLPVTVEATPWFEGGTVNLHAMHRDVVTALPPGARTIGAGPTADHPVLLVDDTMLGIQDHPEYDAAYMRALVEARRDRLGDELADDAQTRLVALPEGNATVARWIVDFLLDRRRSAGDAQRPS